MKRAVALLSLAAVLLVGCKSTGDSTSSSSSSTAPASTEPGQGVTEDAIKVGVTYTDLTSIKDILKLDHGDYLATFQAVADTINEAGGINGRMLELVDAPVDPIGTESGTTACVKLTEDEKVFAVLGSIQSDIIPCYVKDHDTALVGGPMSAAGLAEAQAPWFTWIATQERLISQTIAGAGADGAFDGKKVGVVTTAVFEPLVDSVVRPALSDAGAEIADLGVIDVPADDQAAATAAAQSVAEKFKSEGIDVVISVSQTFQTWANGVAQTDYRPTQISTDSNTVSAWVVAKSPEQLAILDGAIVGGGAPAEAWWNTQAMQDCVAEIEARTGTTVTNPVGFVEGGDTPASYVSAQTACATMTLFQAIADKAGSTLNNDTFLAAGHELGVIQIPGVGGESDYTADDPSGNPAVYLARWDSAQEKLVTDPEPVS